MQINLLMSELRLKSLPIYNWSLYVSKYIHIIMFLIYNYRAYYLSCACTKICTLVDNFMLIYIACLKHEFDSSLLDLIEKWNKLGWNGTALYRIVACGSLCQKILACMQPETFQEIFLFPVSFRVQNIKTILQSTLRIGKY